MRKLLSLFLTVVLIGHISIALADIDLSDMSMNELVSLRDQIDQEISKRGTSLNSQYIYEAEDIVFSFYDVIGADLDTVNEYYDKYEPAYVSSDKCNHLLIPFAFENNSDVLMKLEGVLNDASINGWVVSGYIGIRDIPAHKKAKGFLYLQIQDCDAETIDDVNSAEFGIMIEPDGEYSSRYEIRFKIIRSDKRLMLSSDKDDIDKEKIVVHIPESITVREAVKETGVVGAWEKEYFLDSNENPTNTKYITLSKMLPAGVNTEVKLLIYKSDVPVVEFELYKDGSKLVNNKRQKKEYYIVVDTDGYNPFWFYADTGDNGDSIKLKDSTIALSVSDFLTILKNVKSLKIQFDEKNSDLTYECTIDDTTGFVEAYEWLEKAN